MRILSLRALALIVVAHAPLLAHGATLRVPQNFATIQAAIDAAVDEASLTFTNNVLNNNGPEESAEIECEIRPIVIDSSNIFASPDSQRTRGTCVP